MKTKYPLAVKLTAGQETLRRLRLKCEAPADLGSPDLAGLDEFVTTAHAPFSAEGKRLNIACTDDEWRRRSIDMIAAYIDNCVRFPNVRKIVCHVAPREWYDKDGNHEQRGDYDRLISAFRQLADGAAKHAWPLAIENNRQYWHAQFPNAPGEPGGVSECVYFGCAPEEWLQIVKDVDRDNFRACLDTSHAATYVQRFDPAERADRLMRYLIEPDLVTHVHWSDSEMLDNAGRDDMHLPVGDGTLPRGLHRAIGELDATVLLEHFYDIESLERELAFIEGVLPKR